MTTISNNSYKDKEQLAYIESQDILWVSLADQVESEGLSLYDVEKISSSSIRVVIEKPSAQNRAKLSSFSVEEERDQKEEGDNDADRAMSSEGGVTSRDCSRLCRKLAVFFEVEGEALGLHSDPEIEVSSPGVNRHLRRLEHFQLALGKRVKVITAGATVSTSERQEKGVETNAAGSYVGILRSVESEHLVLNDERSQELVSIPLAKVKKAHVDFAFSGTSLLADF